MTEEIIAPGRYRLFRLDAVEFLRTLPDRSVDLVITDPAYESLEEHRAIGTTTRLVNDWFPIFPNSRYPDLFAELYRVLKWGRHCYVFCDSPTMFVVQPVAVRAGFHFWKDLCWDKRKLGMGYHYRARKEAVLFFEKGKGGRQLRDRSIADVLDQWPRVRTGYPTAKPEGLCGLFVTQSSEPGEVVLDCFVGSGSAGAAAVSRGRDFWGSDITERAITETEQWLRHKGALPDERPMTAGQLALIR